MTPGAGNDRRRLLVNAAANWLGFAAQIAVAFYLCPILVHGLGNGRYGLWSLAESVLVYLTLLDLGIAASLVRYTARFEATGESGRSYQGDVQVVWDDKPAGAIRVMASIDDGGWRAFVPLTESMSMTPR